MLSDITALNAPESENLLLVLVTVVLILYTIAWMQSSPMKFFYSEKNELLNEFLEKTNIRKMTYRPNIFGLWHFG